MAQDNDAARLHELYLRGYLTSGCAILFAPRNSSCFLTILKPSDSLSPFPSEHTVVISPPLLTSTRSRAYSIFFLQPLAFIHHHPDKMKCPTVATVSGVVLLALVALALVPASNAQKPKTPGKQACTEAIAAIVGAAGSGGKAISGTIRFLKADGGTRVTITVNGLKPGTSHPFHGQRFSKLAPPL